jgi:hypothetical protein
MLMGIGFAREAEGKMLHPPPNVDRSAWESDGVRVDVRERREIVQYIKRLEVRLSALLSQHSIAYWLHIYRRLAPSSIGRHKEAATIGLVRAAMEAAIQKHARSGCCQGFAISGQVEIDQIFGYSMVFFSPQNLLPSEMVSSSTLLDWS